VSEFFRKLTRVFFFYLLPIGFIASVVIAYFALQNLILPTDTIFYTGERISEVAKRFRKELLRRKDLHVVNFKTSDGLKLFGHFIKRQNAKANLLVCHGFQGCKELFKDCIDLFSDYNILLFDFRAHGQSEGRFRTLGCLEYKDVLAAAQFLRANTKQNKMLPSQLPLVLLGVSMGGSTCLKALEYEPNLCDAIIVDSSFMSLHDAVYNAFSYKSNLPTYPFAPLIEKMVGFIAKCDIHKMRPIDSLQNIEKPIFFIHSCVDEVIPPTDSLQMYAAARSNSKKLWIGPKCRHCWLHKEYPEIYKAKIEKFLQQALS
jgi:uncharacterized protein